MSIKKGRYLKGGPFEKGMTSLKKREAVTSLQIMLIKKDFFLKKWKVVHNILSLNYIIYSVFLIMRLVLLTLDILFCIVSIR